MELSVDPAPGTSSLATFNNNKSPKSLSLNVFESQQVLFQIAIEKAEEAKLKSKYSSISGGPPHSGAGGGGHSTFLQKRLAKGQKYFDSGDYQMAKQVWCFNVKIKL